jgi:hypothetical protein
MKHVLSVILRVAVATLLTATAVSAQIPRTIAYQGMIAETSSGSPIPDGTHAITVSLYETLTGGTAVYSESQSVLIVKGLFNMMIGATSAIPESIDFGKQYFIGVAIDGGGELLPRTALGSVPYALRTSVAERALLADNASLAAVANRAHIVDSGTPASGDLAGVYPNPTIATNAVTGNKIADQGVALTKISKTGATAGQVLGYNGSSISWTKDGLTLPYSATTRTTQSAIEIIDSAAFSSSGTAPLLRLDSRDTSATRISLRITSNSHGTTAIDASTTGGGSVAVFSKSKDRTTGSGGTFIGPVIVAESRQGSQVTAAEFNALDTANTRPAVDIEHRGKGAGLQVDATGANIANFRRRRVTGNGSSSTSTVVRFDSTGKGFFDNGTQTGGADVAELFEPRGDVAAYEKGDVLVISTSDARCVERSSTPYSALVAGVYATKPGVILTEHTNEEEVTGHLPLGVVGVIPTKVSTENGAIHIGDLLVTSSTAGHAMRGSVRAMRRHPGCILGKALDNLDGTTGVIRVLVGVR